MYSSFPCLPSLIPTVLVCTHSLHLFQELSAYAGNIDAFERGMTGCTPHVTTSAILTISLTFLFHCSQSCPYHCSGTIERNLHGHET